ncbi:MAG: glycogen debranching enzyme family protein [Lachnospiraceae bacterium]|nr:glycogen debranching enzyme family protein [Lachnospiraceae bacterium]
MRFVYGKQDMRTARRAEEYCFLLTNGLGGYASVTSAFSVSRCDQGILVAAVKAPNERITMVHRLSETLQVGEKTVFLSTQHFADKTAPEDGYRHLATFSYEYEPCWTYQVSGVQVTRRMAMTFEENTTAVLYEIENRSGQSCTFRTVPFLRFAPKEESQTRQKKFTYTDGQIRSGQYALHITTNGTLEEIPACWQTLAYPEDEKDGRAKKGKTGACCAVEITVAVGETARLAVIYSAEKVGAKSFVAATETENTPTAMEIGKSGLMDPVTLAELILTAQRERLQQLEESCGLTDPVARHLAVSADAYIAQRESTGGKTILAGYPLFSDWGRDTMIALPGCTLSTGRFEDAKSILRTFLAYEQDGLVPNLFPEGAQQPMYNTVDAALLLIDCVWQYVQRTENQDFVAEAYPVLERIVAAYQRGTKHSIGMDEDGLIFAGGGLDQVTWMDVCVEGILPTPRHGKPVEINAYWYNALRIMEIFAGQMGLDGTGYGALATRVKEAFVEKFYITEQGYLRDVLSGTRADDQLRCNQIWAVSMPFTMLDPEQERNVVDAVYRHLYTPCGLRTLSPEDPEYHGSYGGPQLQRDMAYHQGTTWVFPMGAYYRAYLKVHGRSVEAARTVRAQLEALEPMMREGCVGQLPEIYEGDFPTESKGCFGQAWSVGEMVRVFEDVEKILAEI